jgi:choline dehydrogenase-like flavoprotein
MVMSRIDADVVVVGSGAGGGTMASRLGQLAEAGKRVLVFERGPRFEARHFNGQELTMGELLYRDGGAHMVADGTISLAFAEAYGGSTLVYTGTSLEPPAAVIERWGLDPDDLIRRARHYAEDNGVHFVPENELNDNNRLFASGCENLGWQARRFPVNTRGCKGASLCNLGCPNNAKQGTHAVQLPRAEDQGVEVVTRARVLSVDNGRVELEIDAQPHPLGYRSEWSPGRYTINARAVVVCAGAVGSPALLLRSGLAGSLPALGRYFTCQPAHILVGRHPRALSNAVGHPKSFLWDERIDSDRVFLEACMYFPFVTAKNLAGFGPDHEAFLQAYDRLQMILILACDQARPEHRVSIDRQGEPVVHYRLMPDTIQALVRGTRSAARIFFAAGAEAVHAPSARPTLLADPLHIDQRVSADHFRPGSISVSAAHLMGGCRMGEGSTDSVTDRCGRVHGQRGLFVADASLFPTALEANPYLSLMALADHVADSVIEYLTD